MAPTHIFINGCSFLTDRKKENVLTHTGLELAKLMDLPIVESLAGGGRGNRRISFTTKVWCEKNPELANFLFNLNALEGSLKENATLILDPNTPPFNLLTQPKKASKE